jgi:hypothetical protein
VSRHRYTASVRRRFKHRSASLGDLPWARDVADLAQQLGGQHRPDPEQLHQGRLGLGHCGLDVGLDRGDASVQVAHVGDKVTSELVAAHAVV